MARAAETTPNSPAVLRSMRPPSVRMPPRNFTLAGNADALDQKLGERDLALGCGEGSLPHGDGKTAVAVDGTQVEENIDGQ